MGNITIAPMDRIEGHLDIEATTVGGLVTNVQNQCVMFRGLENVMVKRDPRDAPIITSRV
jgi:Ni,Fe-hydrogenase I large subunit